MGERRPTKDQREELPEKEEVDCVKEHIHELHFAHERQSGPSADRRIDHIGDIGDRHPDAAMAEIGERLHDV